MMNRAMSAMAFVIIATMIGGILGGLVGYEVGRLSPQFVATIASGNPEGMRPSFKPDEFGLGLGIVSGLFFGAGSSLLLIVVISLREAWMARLALQKRPD
ncbi:MAG: hypothetical protein JWN86_1475 [Planctomycetota bacterium]|nr:hypothetical protein [Planctomycetota bacterium]